jgi:hypothetical protein
MSKINFTPMVSIDEAKSIIGAIGNEVTCILVSEPGVGKSSILSGLAEMNGDQWRKVGDNFPTDKYDYIYIDCPVKDMMDVAASIPNHQSKSLEYYVSSLFKLDNGKPKVIMADEAFKAPKLMQIIYTRMYLERTVGDIPLPAGSIVFGTSNNASDGVGDNLLSHVGNRVCILNMSKPSHEEWLRWANKNGISRLTRAWAAMNPRAFKSYLDSDQQDNPYIFKPSSTNKQFVSPRSLAKSSVVIERKHKYTENGMMVALSGIVGEAAAKSMAAFIAVEDKILKYEDVLKDPTKVAVPDEVAVLVQMLFEAIDNIETQDALNSYMEFVNRIKHSEIQTIFFTMMMRTKPRVARYNQQLSTWAAANHIYMG